MPPQSAWPHKQLISLLFPMPSQWALQYFPFSGAGQVQAAFAHFFGVLAIVLLRRYPRCRSIPSTRILLRDPTQEIVAQTHVHRRAKSAGTPQMRSECSHLWAMSACVNDLRAFLRRFLSNFAHNCSQDRATDRAAHNESIFYNLRPLRLRFFRHGSAWLPCRDGRLL